jgi:hypothetical protein
MTTDDALVRLLLLLLLLTMTMTMMTLTKLMTLLDVYYCGGSWNGGTAW